MAGTHPEPSGRGAALRRRTLLRAIAGAAAARLPGRAALAAIPNPPAPGADWPVCDSTVRHYCVESLTVDGVDRLLELYNAEVWGGLGYSVNCGYTSSHLDVADTVGISFAESTPNNLDLTLLDRQIDATIRFGKLQPREIASFSVGFQRTVSGSASTGWTLRISGKPTLIPWQHTPDWSFITFRATASDPDPLPDGWNLDGFYMAAGGTNAYGPPWWDGEAWNFYVGATDFAHDGSYRAWLPTTMVDLLGLTSDDAAEADALEVAADGASIAATISKKVDPRYGDGILIDIPVLPIAAPTVGARSARPGRPGQMQRVLHPASTGTNITVRANRAPDAPQITKAAPGPARATLTVSRGSGGTPDGYVARCVAPGLPERTTQATTPGKIVVKGLAPGVPHTCDVTAANSLGSATSDPVVVTPKRKRRH